MWFTHRPVDKNRMLGRQNGEDRDTRERHKKDDLQSPSPASRNNGSWESTVSSGQGIVGCLKEEGFSWSFQEWGSRGRSFWEAMVLFYFSELLKSRRRVEDFWWLVWQRARDDQGFRCCAEGPLLALCVGRKYRGTKEASVPALHFTHTGFLLVVCH